MSWLVVSVDKLQPIFDELGEGVDHLKALEFRGLDDEVVFETELGYRFAIEGRVFRNFFTAGRESQLVDLVAQDYVGTVLEDHGYQSYWQHTRIGR